MNLYSTRENFPMNLILEELNTFFLTTFNKKAQLARRQRPKQYNKHKTKSYTILSKIKI